MRLLKNFAIYVRYSTNYKQKRGKMKNIKILMSQCGCNIAFAESVEKIVKESGLEASVSRIDDVVQMLPYNVMTLPALVVDERLVSTGKISEDKIKDVVEKKKPNIRIIRVTNMVWSKKNLGLTVPYPSDNYQKPMIKGAKKAAAKKSDDKSPENQLIKLREEMKPKMIYEFFQEKTKGKKKGKKKK